MQSDRIKHHVTRNQNQNTRRTSSPLTFTYGFPISVCFCNLLLPALFSCYNMHISTFEIKTFFVITTCLNKEQKSY